MARDGGAPLAPHQPIDKEIIRKVVRQNANQIRRCYESRLEIDPSLHGKLKIEFVIGPDGKVKSSVLAQNDLESPEVGLCIADAFLTWQFPKPQGWPQIRIVYPLILQRTGVDDDGGRPSESEPDDFASSEPIAVEGSPDKELVRQVIHRNRDQLQSCYDIARKLQPALAGTIVVTFVIGPDGAVQSSKIAQSTMNNPEFEACIAARFKTFQMPKPKGGAIVQITYPLVFSSAADGG